MCFLSRRGVVDHRLDHVFLSRRGVVDHRLDHVFLVQAGCRGSQA